MKLTQEQTFISVQSDINAVYWRYNHISTAINSEKSLNGQSAKTSVK
jgi:hypothetical protein